METNNNILNTAYTEYFDLLDGYFRGIYQPGIDKDIQANYIIRMEKAAKVILLSIDDIADDIAKFWNKYAGPVLSYIREKDIFKALYCGQISPLEGQQFVKRTAMYVDSILIEDPISALVRIKNLSTDNAYLLRMIQHAFNLMDMKELFFDIGGSPILTIYPSFHDDDNNQKLKEYVHNYGLLYFSELLDNNFNDIDSFLDYFKSFNNPDKLTKVIKQPEMLPKNENQSIYDFVNEVYKSIVESRRDSSGVTIGTALAHKILGQLTGIGTYLFQSSILNSQLAFDSEYYWKIYKWNINHQNKDINIDDLVLNSLNLENFSWLGNIPIDKLILLKKEGELSKVRNVLRKNIYSCTSSKGDITEISSKALYNIEEALKEHNSQVKEIEKALRKKFIIDGPIIILGIVSAIFSGPLSLVPTLGLASTIYGGCDLTKSIITSFEMKKHMKTGVFGMLFNAKK